MPRAFRSSSYEVPAPTRAKLAEGLSYALERFYGTVRDGQAPERTELAPLVLDAQEAIATADIPSAQAKVREAAYAASNLAAKYFTRTVLTCKHGFTRGHDGKRCEACIDETAMGMRAASRARQQGIPFALVHRVLGTQKTWPVGSTEDQVLALMVAEQKGVRHAAE